MQYPNLTDPQFVDANGTGGFNAAFGTVSGSIAAFGSGAYASPGLVAPETMTVSFSGMVASVGLPIPFGILASGGVLVRAHGTLTNHNVTNYTVDFGSLVPVSGSVTAYLSAQIVNIQQNSVPLPGPPPGHPSYDPNYVPTVGYATNVYSLSTTAVSGSAPDNAAAYELFRTTLTAGQTAVAVWSLANQRRASPRMPRQSQTVNAGGTLVVRQLDFELVTTVGGITSTLPAVGAAAGMPAVLHNASAANWTISCTSPDVMSGAFAAGTVNSLVVPPHGSMSLWANGLSGEWEVVSLNPATLESLANTWGKTNTFTAGVVSTGTDAGGANFRWLGGNYGAFLFNNGTSSYLLQTASGDQFGAFNAFRPFAWDLTNGSVTIDGTGVGTTLGGPVSVDGGLITMKNGSGNKSLRTVSDVLQIINDAFTSVLATFDDVGNLSMLLSLIATLDVSAGRNVSAGADVTAGVDVASTRDVVSGRDVNATRNVNATQKATAGTDASAGIDLPRLGQFAAAISGNGYIKIPTPLGGPLIVQWINDSVPEGGTPTSYSLPISFPNGGVAAFACYGASLPPIDSGSIGATVSDSSLTVTDGSPGSGSHGFSALVLGF